MATPLEQALERVTKLPTPAKAGILAGTVVVLTLGNYFMFVSDDETAFDKAVKQEAGLEDKMIQNQQIAKNLNQYRNQKEALEQQLAKALQELPEEANVEGLIESMNEMGTKAGLQVTSIDPKKEAKGPDGLYAEIPLGMKVIGSFQEIAVFFDSVRQIKRIININDIKLSNPTQKNDKILLNADFVATAFRFMPQTKDATDTKK